jgi:hypothetical protein
MVLMLGITACTQKTDLGVEAIQKKSPDSLIKKALKDTELFEKNQFQVESDFLDDLRFAGQVEAEIFKIVDHKFKNTQKIPSQLMILSQLLDLKFDKKIKLPTAVSVFYNCNKIMVQSKTEKEFDVLRTCEKNGQVIARIKKNSINQFQVNFIQSEWQTVIGDSAMLNLKDKICYLTRQNNKVSEVSCDNTLITIGSGTQLEEIKLHHFKFDRNAKNQIVVSGGRFKDFLERSKINILVPEEGKIKFKEEELNVRDDYVDSPASNQPVKDFIPPAPSENNSTNEININNPLRNEE